MIVIERIASGDAHTDQKWLTLRGSVPGTPVAKVRNINTASLVDGSVTLEGEQAKLRADVEEYHARWLAVEAALEKINGRG